MKCASCGAEASGNFCMACGQPLKAKKCSSCGSAVAPGARFCTSCGAGLKGGKGPGSAGGRKLQEPVSGSGGGNANLGWWVAGGLLVVVLFALGYPILTRDTGAAGPMSAPAGMGGATGGATAVDLTTMTLEEQGTILFNRVMTSNSNGDTADVEFFQPKALVIYEQLNPTDPDGLYHFALLYQVGEDFEAALAKAQEGLAEIPDYLLLLAVAGEASESLGDEAAARQHYGRFLEVYDTEMALLRPGYEHHQAIFPAYKEEAEAYLNRG